jgi:hypothetical protein
MHAAHFDPRRILIAALAALALALAVAAAMPRALDGVSFGGGGVAQATAPATPAPVWATDPLASPLRTFATP